MPLTRLDNLYSSKTGKYLYVSPDDFNATDAIDNRGNSPLRPFVSIQRAFLEVARYSYVPNVDNDRFDQFTIMLAPGNHYIDNRPGDLDVNDIPIFDYNPATDEWNDESIFDLGNPNNILYRFNGRDGGATIPRGTSLVGTDLRRTQVRALYVPDPADKDVPRTALFNVTGGCYFWQFTILDANDVNGPLNGKAYNQPGSTQTVTPLFSHHKMTNFVFADREDLGLLYRKIAKSFSKYQPSIDDVYTVESGRVEDTWYSTTTYAVDDEVVFGGEGYKALQANTNKRPDLEDTFWERLSTISREFDYRVQENRIVGPLSDTVQIDQFSIDEPQPGYIELIVRTKINHQFFPGQYVAIANLGYNKNLEGVFQVLTINPTNPKEFTYRVNVTANAVGLNPSQEFYIPDPNATVQAEVDSVESASPYVFNVSIRSTWGICGIWADGRKATGFKSMVIAQYTGVSLQKDDRAFIRYDEFSNTWNEAPLTDAFATTPYHIKGDAYWKDDWRNFHVRASDDSFIQNVSIFAVGFADHFLLESGGDMSITNSNSNFGNTSMHSKGYKGFAFNQDKGGYITDIIPPRILDDTKINRVNYYAINVSLSRTSSNSNRLYLVGNQASNFLDRPAASVNGFRIGARTYINDEKCERLYVNISADTAAGESGATTKSAVVAPQGFKKWSTSIDTLSPLNLGVGDLDGSGIPDEQTDIIEFNLRQDAANLIDSNKTFIQAEAFGYILEKYPNLQNISYVNPNITAETGRYRDASNLISANRQEIIDYAFNQMQVSFPSFTVPGTNGDEKCKRDIGYIVDALAKDLYNGGNNHIIEATRAYFDATGALTTEGLAGETTQSIFAFNRAKDWAKKAISNLLDNTSLLSVASITSSGTTVTVTTNTAHNLDQGQSVTVGGATQSQYNGQVTVLATGLTATQFRYTAATAPTVSPATGAYYVSTVIIDPVNDDPEVGRYKDASKLVTANRQEIIDRAFGEIAIQYNESLWGIDWVVPGDTPLGPLRRYFDSYRLIQKNRNIIVESAYKTVVDNPPSPAPANLLAKCKRDIGYFVDALSLDILEGGANRYTRKFVQQYFSGNTTLLTNGLAGEVTQSITAFNKARDAMKAAITNTLSSLTGLVTSSPAGGTWVDGTTGTKTVYTDLTLTADPLTGSNTNPNSCAGVRAAVDTLAAIVSTTLTAVNLSTLPPETVGLVEEAGEIKCKRDIGYIVDSIAQDLFWGGNEFTVGSIREYFANNTTLTTNGLSGEVTQSIIAFNAARDMVNKAVTNQLYSKNLTLSYGEAEYGGGGGVITYTQSGNAATCVDVQNTVTTLFGIITTTLQAQNLSALPPVDNGQWDCANVRSTIDTLTSILTTALATQSLVSLPPEDIGQWSIVSDTSKCKRDIGYIVEAVTSDLRLGGNEATVRAAEAYYTGNSLDYIENEKVETLDAYDYVRNLAISSMRNHNTYAICQATGNSSIITVPSTNGLVLGMEVKSVTTLPSNTGSVTTEITNYNDELEQIVNGRVVPKSTNVNDNIPVGAYIKKIGDGTNGLAINQIELGEQGSKFDLGDTVVAKSSLGNNVPVNLFFALNAGVWSNSIEPVVDNTVIQDYSYNSTAGQSECNSVKNTINNYFGIITQIIDNGLGVVDIEYSQINTGSFAQRATLFTLTDTSSGSLPTDPHHLETGTPVRLVPRAREGSNVDKRLIRLPKGFDTNTVYYVIAPGRKTDPYDYSTFNRFNASAGSLQNLMLASSVENAASGIYIYSSESNSVHPDVVIDMYQYVLDVNYDLNNYITRKVTGSGTLLETDEPHVFDVPTVAYNTNDTQKYQAIFFKPIGSGSLPALSSGGNLTENREYYVRYVDRKRFRVFDTLSNAVQNTSPLQFSNFSSTFYTLSNKKRSPLRFAPEAGAQQSFDEVRLYVEDKSLFAPNDYVRVDDEYFQVTSLSPSGGSDFLFVIRSVLGSSPQNHYTGAVVTKWGYGVTATVTTVNEPVDGTETILDFATTAGFTVNDYVRLTNSGTNSNSATEIVKITAIEGNQVIVVRGQLGTFAVPQPGSIITAVKVQLTITSTTTTLSQTYPQLLQSVSGADYGGGNWYINTDTTKQNTILERIRRPDFAVKDKTPDTWYQRVEDSREKEDRVYRLRYVIPRYLRSVRDPLRGFVVKLRNDNTRRLLPQRILVKPVANSPEIPQLTIVNPTAALATRPDLPGYEFLGYTNTEHGPTFTSLYDPYNPQTNSEIDLTPKYRVKITTDSKVTTYVQSARKRVVGGKEYLELVVFNTGIEEQGYKDKLFTTVKIDSPEGGNGVFVSNIANLPQGNTSNVITWSGACKGSARVHSYFEYENQYYMILKDINITSTLTYSPFETVTFQQGSVTANLIDYPDGGRSDKNNFLYVVEGSNVYTMTPGDTFNAPNGSYVVASVEDLGDIENTFYIFDIDEVRRRIYGQQDGIYYLTCMRANISPFPTGAGVGENFRDFKFSQPVSSLYPEFYKNDPEWYKQLNSEDIDPPATISSADNYIHGLVTVNDSKNSVTKEAVIDLINDPGTGNYEFSGDKAIQAQEGGASAGSESRKISISGNSPYPTEGKLYVELRRPSIARSGNHTFEYLGFGPGNYSTGFPARQEVVLTDIQDFYAQAKRENGGIVFYTGLNSNGDLYIGNRKINAITGEETFLESAQVSETEDQADEIGNFVTTFDDPVVFNDVVSFLAPLENGVNFFTSPVLFDVGTVISETGLDAPSAITVKTNINSATDDSSLALNPTTGLLSGDIKIGENRITTAVLQINPRGSQQYSLRTANYQFTPDQNNTFGNTSISFGSKYRLKTGDIILKGSQVDLTGSLGWIYSNNFADVPRSRMADIQGFGIGFNYIRINWATKPSSAIRYTNSEIGISSLLYQIRISGVFVSAQNSGLNAKVRGVWAIKSDTYSPTATFIELILNDSIDVGSYPIDGIVEPNIVVSISNTAWKEVGVLGSESIRTETNIIGDYKVGINTVARSAHTAYENAFISSETTPRANLDVVGTTFISGKKVLSYLTESGTLKTETNQDNALMVGGNSEIPSNTATFRVSTTNSGRVGINANLAQTDRTLTVIGNGRITGDFRFESDIEVNGGDITSTNTTFNLVNQSTLNNLNIGAFAKDINLFASTNAPQTLNIGVTSTNSILNVHTNATASIINLANSIFSTKSLITIGGATNNPVDSLFRVRNAISRFDGNMEVNGGNLASTASTVNLFSVSGFATTLNIGKFTTTLNLGGIAGTTTIRNAATINGTARVNGNIILNGGLDNSSVTVIRGALGSTATFHPTGSASNLNVTYLKFINDIDGFIPITNILIASNTLIIAGGNPFKLNDVVRFNTTANGVTAGIDYYVVGNINNISFQVSTQPNGVGTITPISGTLDGLEITLKNHFLDTEGGRTYPGQAIVVGTLNNEIITSGHTFINGDTIRFTSVIGLAGVSTDVDYFVRDVSTNNFRLSLTNGGASINITGTPDSVEAYASTLFVNNPVGIELFDYLLVDNEIVQAVTPPTTQFPYFVRISRGLFGTTIAPHADQTVFNQVEVTPNATYVSPNAIANSTVNIVELAEFGGEFSINDYLLIDNEFVRITAINASSAKSIFVNTGTVGDNVFTVASTTGNTYARGTLQVDKSITLSGSGTPNTDLFTITNGAGIPAVKFQVDSATGNTLNDGTLTVNNSITLNGNVNANTEYFTITNGAPTPTQTFRVDSATGLTEVKGDLLVNVDKFIVSATTGNTTVGRFLTVSGLAAATPSSGVDVFSVNNLGVNGVDSFTIKQDGSITAFGEDNFFNRNGGKKCIFITTENNTDASVSTVDNTVLRSNLNYFVKPSGSDSFLVLRLPSNPVTGDIIRFVDVGGNLSYNCTLVIRAPIVSGNATRIQGDPTGTRAGGLSSSYGSGELLINTPNAAFGLIYLGSQDSEGTTIGSTQQGWWLMEI